MEEPEEYKAVWIIGVLRLERTESALTPSGSLITNCGCSDTSCHFCIMLLSSQYLFFLISPSVGPCLIGPLGNEDFSP